MSIFLFLAVGTVATLSMMRFSIQCNEKFVARHGRSVESEVQQALKRQFLDCEHLFLISDLAESVLKIVRLVDERRREVVELLHVFVSVSFRDVADQCCIC